MSKKIIPYDDFGRKFPSRDKWDIIGTLTTTCGRNALGNSWKIIEYEDDEETNQDKAR